MQCSSNKCELEIRLKNNLFFKSCDNLNFADQAGCTGKFRGLLFRGSRIRCTGFEPERCIPIEATFALRA